MPRRAGIAGALAAAAALAVCAVALATTVPDVLYDPPRLTFTDRYAHATGEDLEVAKEGRDFVFRNPDGMVRHPDSEGCDESFATEMHCPVAGVEVLVLRLRDADDRARVELGGRADDVSQRINGGNGFDVLRGGRGRQRIRGGPDDDTLRGGRGPDLLVGGDGVDDCRGGPGKDTLVACE